MSKKSYPQVHWVFLSIPLGLILLWGSVNTFRHFAFHSSMYDLGNMTQGILKIWHTGWPFNTAEGMIVPRLAVHAEWIFYLLSPIVAFYQSPVSLIWIQTVLLFSSFWIWYSLARQKLSSSQAISAFMLSLTLLPSWHRANYQFFHGDTLAVFFLSLMLWSHCRHKRKLYWLSVVLALSCKEYVAILVLGWSFYLISQRHPQKRHYQQQGLATAILCFVWIAVMWLSVKVWMHRHFPEAAEIGARISAGVGWAEVGENIRSNPWQEFKKLISIEQLKGLGMFVLPFAGVGFWKKRKGICLCLALPLLGLFITGSLGSERRIISLFPFICYFSLLSFKKIEKEWEDYSAFKRYSGLLAWIISCIISLYLNPLLGVWIQRDYVFRSNAYVQAMEAGVEKADAYNQILANNHLAIRFVDKEVVLIPGYRQKQPVQAMLIDWSHWSRSLIRPSEFLNWLGTGEYSCTWEQDSLALFEKDKPSKAYPKVIKMASQLKPQMALRDWGDLRLVQMDVKRMHDDEVEVVCLWQIMRKIDTHTVKLPVTWIEGVAQSDLWYHWPLLLQWEKAEVGDLFQISYRWTSPQLTGAASKVWLETGYFYTMTPKYINPFPREMSLKQFQVPDTEELKVCVNE